MKRVSSKMARQKRAESKLTKQLMERCGGLCEICKRAPDWRGLSKHEKVFRSKGGDPLDPANCVMVCARCHSGKHRIHEQVTPYSKAAQLGKR